jgi:hypothetical protein
VWVRVRGGHGGWQPRRRRHTAAGRAKPAPPSAAATSAAAAPATEALAGLAARPPLLGRRCAWRCSLVRDASLLRGSRVQLPGPLEPRQLDLLEPELPPELGVLQLDCVRALALDLLALLRHLQRLAGRLARGGGGARGGACSRVLWQRGAGQYMCCVLRAAWCVTCAVRCCAPLIYLVTWEAREARRGGVP